MSGSPKAIDVDATKAGAMFRALVDDPVMIDGKVVIPRSAAVVVQAVRVEQSGQDERQRQDLAEGELDFVRRPAPTRSSPPMSRRKDRAKARRPHERSAAVLASGAIVGGIAGGGARCGDWCGGGRGHRRRGRQPGSGALAAAGRNPPAVPVDRGGHGQAIARDRSATRRAYHPLAFALETPTR